jgi:hypothetical protein
MATDEGGFETVADVIKQSAKDFSKVQPGHNVALIDNYALSTDSYPLLTSIAKRKVLKNEGEIIPVIDNGTYRMVSLNKYGVNPKGLQNIDKSIKALREITGDSNIPDRFSIFGKHYVPIFVFKKYNRGGKINKLNFLK